MLKLTCENYFHFQHIVFSIKFLIAYIIPDIPADVKMALSKVCSESSVTHFTESRIKLQKILLL